MKGNSFDFNRNLLESLIHFEAVFLVQKSNLIQSRVAFIKRSAKQFGNVLTTKIVYTSIVRLVLGYASVIGNP